jgi:hypothetical protein
MMFRNLFRVSLRQTLPRLRHQLTSGRKLDTPDEETQILLDAGLQRDWMNARMLLKRSGKTPLALFWELSKKRKADWRGRLRNRFIDVIGGYRFDPHKRELRELIKGKDPTRR